MPQLSGHQFGEQLSLFGDPGSGEVKPAVTQTLEPKYYQLHLPFPTPAPSRPKMDWSRPVRQSDWAASARLHRSLRGAR